MEKSKKESNSFNFYSMQSLEVFLYRSPELPYPVLREICDLMQTIKGPIKFKMLEKEESREVATKSNPKSLRVKSWKQLFEEVNQYRSHHNIQDAYMVFQLTNHPNEYGFYAAVDEKTKSLSFINCAYQDLFSDSTLRYPIAFNIVAMLLLSRLFDKYSELEYLTHQTPRGCLMDWASDRKELLFKMRTGDLCEDCLNVLKKKKIDASYSQQLFQFLDAFSLQMKFKQRLELNPAALKMEIRGVKKEIYFPQLGDLNVRLTPLEKTVYFLFMAHPEGIEMVDIPSHKNELMRIYKTLSIADEEDTITARVNQLCDPRDNSIHEKLAKIKAKFEQALGKESAKAFYISGPRAGLRTIKSFSIQ